MSTGLTWVTPIDASAASPDFFSGPVQFADYNEAYDYANWLVRLYVFSFSVGTFRIAVYTTSPNQNGFWYYDGGVATFEAFD